jgi:transposase
MSSRETGERAAKRKQLRHTGTLNLHPERVQDPLFQGSDFFDPDDLVQVKYEMLRRVETDQWSVCQATEAFGFSRPVYYQARAAFDREGLAGLVPQKRGPKGGHKLTGEILAFVDQLTTEASLSSAEVARCVAHRFGLQVHPRSIERAQQRSKKKPSRTE